jgi:hypothetical protein
MRKTYVKPMAANVAFVVNENIATSLDKFQKPGQSKLNFVEEGTCNKYFFTTKIETGLPEGVYDANQAIGNLGEDMWAHIQSVMNTPGHELFETYQACFFS